MVSYHNIMGFMYVFARYLLMGARNCWGLSSVLFLLMAALAFLYEDEVTTRRDFPVIPLDSLRAFT